MRRENNKWLPTVTDEGIYGFFGEYRWLSNFHICPVYYEDMLFISSEHAYQAAKTTDLDIRSLFQQLPTPRQAKQFGSAIEIRKDWNEIRVEVMRQCLLSKFKSPTEKWKLLSTNSMYLEETNYWHDTFWGVCDGVGENTLGQLLMEIRDGMESMIVQKHLEQLNKHK